MDLRLHDIDPGDLLRHRVLDLDARIDFDEVDLAGVGIHQELDRAGADIVGGARQLHRMLGKVPALRVVQIGRRRALHDLLVAPLDRAVALEQMHDIAVRVAQNLDLDMARALDQLFQIDLVLAESRLGLPLRFGDLALEILFRADHAHAAAAAAPGGFQHHRIADFGGHLADLRHVVGKRFRRRNDRHADLDREVARGDLVAEPAHRLRLRADEDQAAFRAGLGEFRAFGQQAVAGMHRVGAGLARHPDDLLDREIALDRSHLLVEMRAAADLIAFVGLEAMQRVLVLLRPDRDGLQPQLVRRAKHADGDLGSIGDEDLGDRQGGTPIRAADGSLFLIANLLQCKHGRAGRCRQTEKARHVSVPGPVSGMPET